jgi:UDP-glucose:glycoprotein glucosyltransferase
MSKKKFTTADKPAFQAAITDREIRSGATSRRFEEIMQTNEFEDVMSRTSAYLKRLDCDGKTPLALVNGVVMSRDENWMQEMPMRLTKDVQSLQLLLTDGVLQEDTWLAGHFLSQSALSRSEWIIPKDPNDIRIINLAMIASSNSDVLNTLPRVTSGDDENGTIKMVHIIVISDFNTKQGLEFLTATLNFCQAHPEADVILLHNPEIGSSKSGTSSRLYHLRDKGQIDAAQLLGEINALPDVSGWNLDEDAADEISSFWEGMRPLVTDFGFAPGKSGIVLNGIAVGPPPSNVAVSVREFEQLLAYERLKRIDPVSKSLTALKLDSKISDPFDFAKITSLVALATISDIPEGIFESGSKLRVNILTEWMHDFAVIDVTNSLDAKINVIAAIDPTTEQAQRWIPILKVLSKLVGVNVKILLNPRDQIQELPIKRFYRHVIEAEPRFDGVGALRRPGASFTGLP